MSSSIKTMDPVAEVARRARVAGRSIAALSGEARNEILLAVAFAIEESTEEILAINQRDCEAVESEVVANRMPRAFLDRLQTSGRGVADMAAKVRAVAELPDPLGRTIEITSLAENLTLHKVTCPLGAIGIIFEPRPDVIPPAGALCP